MKVPPMMNTVSILWNILVDEAAGCAGCLSVVDWLGDCRGRRRVINVSSFCRKSIFMEERGWRNISTCDSCRSRL